MNSAQIQLYIDEKNWDELADCILDLDYYSNIRFTREFLDEFLLSGKYNYAFENRKKDKVSSFFLSLFKRLVLSNIELTKDDYIKIVDLAIYLNKKYNNELLDLSLLLSISKYKNKEYVKLFLDQSFIEKIKSFFRNDVYHTFYFTESHFDGLTPEEVREILTNINNSFSPSRIDIRPTTEYDESIFSAIAESPEELISLDLSKYGLHGETYGSILRNLPAKKFKELVELLYKETKDFWNKYDALDKLISLMDYHEYNNNSLKVEYTDKEIADILSHDYNIFYILKKLAPCLTLEQAKKYSKEIDIEDLLKNKKLSIKQIGEIFTEKNAHPHPISYYRFVREEDLLDAPHLFNPDIVLSIPSIYCSKKTFSVLNKEWGTRKRWSSDLIDFKKIFINNAQNNNIDEDSFIYLIQKAKPSNEEIFNTLKEAGYYLKKAGNSEFLKNIKYILAFLEKYKQ